jgi:hypothetical protein
MYSGLRESDRAVTRALVVDRSTTGRISGGFNGNLVDRIAAQAIAADPKDEKNHLAKVRVAGSRLVVRSNEYAPPR